MRALRLVVCWPAAPHLLPPSPRRPTLARPAGVIGRHGDPTLGHPAPAAHPTRGRGPLRQERSAPRARGKAELDDDDPHRCTLGMPTEAEIRDHLAKQLEVLEPGL